MKTILSLKTFMSSLQVDRNKKGLVGKLTNYALGIEFIRNYIFKKAREQVMKLSGGLYPAPLKVSVVEQLICL